ncbi:MAG: hypothetical protein E3J86_06985 [Candidatus Thorarchaeota archaeon]|nr:MAG: hypothetical protein E3J86_06985 [Candidatus Thorarchaeota archaeon]
MNTNRKEDSLVKPLEDVMRFLENYTLAWHHWLMLLSLLKLGGSGKKSQILPVYKKEGFSSHCIDQVFQTDLVDLGEAVEVEGGIENLTDRSTIFLTEDLKFRRFLKKHLRPVVNTFKTRKPK